MGAVVAEVAVIAVFAIAASVVIGGLYVKAKQAVAIKAVAKQLLANPEFRRALASTILDEVAKVAKARLEGRAEAGKDEVAKAVEEVLAELGRQKRAGGGGRK